MLSTSLIVSLISLISLVNASNLYNFIYTTDSKAKLVYVSIDDSSVSLEKSILNCSVISDPDVVSELLNSPSDSIITVDDDSFDTLVKSCEILKPTSVLSTNPLSSLPDASQLLIAPGTKWCGPGNRASSYDDLGVRVETDKCCRTHDHCPMNIAGFETDYGLTNLQPYTSSLCDCDRELKTCLKEASKTESEAALVGAIYFNILMSKCFQKVQPKGQCLEYSGLLIKRCEKRGDPNSTEPVYQFSSSGLFI